MFHDRLYWENRVVQSGEPSLKVLESKMDSEAANVVTVSGPPLPPPPTKTVKPVMSLLSLNFDHVFESSIDQDSTAFYLWKYDMHRREGMSEASSSEQELVNNWRKVSGRESNRWRILSKGVWDLFKQQRKRINQRKKTAKNFKLFAFRMWKWDQRSIAELKIAPQKPKVNSKSLKKGWTSLKDEQKQVWMSKSKEFLMACQRTLSLPNQRLEAEIQNFSEDSDHDQAQVNEDLVSIILLPDLYHSDQYQPRSEKKMEIMVRHREDDDAVRVPLDNSMSPFIPRLTSKPNAKMESVHFKEGDHPYQLEIEEWTPSSIHSTFQTPIAPRKLLDTPLLVVDNEEALDTFMEHVSGCTELAVDVEHHSKHSFLGHTCILQISTRTQDFILDCMSLGLKLERLNAVLTDPKVLKVFHGANSDILWLQRDCGVYVVGLFDTYFATKQLGLKENSLRFLLQEYCNVVMSQKEKKKWQLADWRLRPLSDDMKHYARQDTHYLLYIFDLMKNALLEKGAERGPILAQVFKDSSKLCLQQYEKPICNPEPLLVNFPNFNHFQKQAFIELYKWRDSVARDLDESTSAVMSKRKLKQLVEMLPETAADITRIWKHQLTNINNHDAEADAQYLDQVKQILLDARDAPEDEPLGIKAMKLWIDKQLRNPNTKARSEELVAKWGKMDKEDQRTWRWAARNYLEEQKLAEQAAAAETGIRSGIPRKSGPSNPFAKMMKMKGRAAAPPSKSEDDKDTDNQLVLQFRDMQLGSTSRNSAGLAGRIYTPAYHFDALYIEDYRDLPVIPSTMELLSGKNNTLPAGTLDIRSGDIETYVDTHFRLLREDFLRAVKNGVTSFRSGNMKPQKAHVHRDIKISQIKTKGDPRDTRKQWIMVLPKKLSHSLGEGSSRFLAGHLLLFSTDAFSTIHYGLIQKSSADTWFRNFNTGVFEISVKFCGEDPPWDKTQKFVTLEPEPYFEPYRRVLDALKAKDYETFPLAPYLVQKSRFEHIPPPPAYLRQASTYRLDQYEVNPSTPERWPGAKKFGLDPAQYEGIKSALTQEFVLIQGPPGTGKTYLGVRIVKMLVDNRSAWMAPEKTSGRAGGPILVMCYTNHALDQFLEGVLDIFTPKDPETGQPVDGFVVTNPRIIRLGGGSTCDRTAQYKWTNYNPAAAKADIIFVTTTGAAKRHKEVAKLRSRIMIVEEAAEVFEAHIAAAFTEHLQHVILLGDHKQLKPLTATHKMAADYNLDVSLFERLVRNNFRRNILTQQHRMRPVIRDLITGTIYKTLTDHPKVSTYPKRVYGMDKNLFFIDHIRPEASPCDSHSKINLYEAEFLVSLAEFLILQGYEASQIVVLATYMSQVKLLKSLMQDRVVCQPVCVETADSYQGEENDIVLLSLVRSNAHDDIGFMRTDNRICVALSRARHGLYIIGNMKLLARASVTWSKINTKLCAGSNIGPALPVVLCKRHGLKQHVGEPDQLLQLLGVGCAKCLEKI